VKRTEVEVFFRMTKHRLNVEKEAKRWNETFTKVISVAWLKLAVEALSI